MADEAAAGARANELVTKTGSYKQLLFINEYPPNTGAGAPVIARQLFRHYDPQKMDVICCGSWAKNATEKVRQSFLPCRHHIVPSYRLNLRPRRIFGPIESTLDCMRLPKIMELGRKVARERKVEALFTMSYGAEMPHAAYFLSKELGLPLYYFETDRLDSFPSCPRAKKLIDDNRHAFLHSVKKLWLTSPKMVRDFKRLWGVDGEYLFHFVDVERYQTAARDKSRLPSDRYHLVYTGSINGMFYDTMKWFCDWLNRGLVIDGRPVTMTIYSAACPPALLGPRVTWPGLVPFDEIPSKLAEAHVAAILVSFTEERRTKEQIQTSLYTKTIDYLAAGLPVLVISPRDSAEVDCFQDVSAVVDRADEAAVVATLKRLLNDEPYAAGLRERGLEMVRKLHSMEALHQNFLAHFRHEA